MDPMDPHGPMGVQVIRDAAQDGLMRLHGLLNLAVSGHMMLARSVGGHRLPPKQRTCENWRDGTERLKAAGVNGILRYVR